MARRGFDLETALVTLQAIGMPDPVTKLISDGVATGKHGIEIAKAQVVQAMQAAEHGCPAEVIRDATALQGNLCLAMDAIRSKHPLPLPALRENVEAAQAVFEVDRTFFWDLRFKAITSLAESLDIAGDCKEAIPHYESALATVRGLWVERHPDITKEILASNLNNLALCYEKLGEYSRALPLYREAAALEPDANVCPATDNLQKLEVFLNRPLAPSAESSSEAMTLDRGAEASARLRDLGTEAYRARKYEAAVRWYSAALAAYEDAPAPVRARLLVNRATARFQLRDLEAAESDARAATGLDPQNSKAFFRLGRVLLASENASAAAAVDVLETATMLAPKDDSIISALCEAKAALEERRQQQGQQQHGDSEAQEDAVASGKNTRDALTGSAHFRGMVDESARLAKVFDGAVS